MKVGPFFKRKVSDGPKVLVADDDVIVQSIMRSLLMDAGYTVISAMNGREAVISAANFRVSIAFIDLAMPEGNGLQICSALRKVPGWSDVPIIVLTHYSLNQALKASLNAGASGFLCKPLVPSELSWCLDTHTKRRALTAVEGSASRNASADQLDLPTEQLPPFASPWILQAPRVSYEQQSNSLKKPVSIDSVYSNHNVFCNELSRFKPHAEGCSVETPNAANFAERNVVAQCTAHQPGLQSVDVSVTPDMETLHRVAALFAPGGLARLLKLLIVSIEEILLELPTNKEAPGSIWLLDRLHKLAGTAGTLGCGFLSDAARELEYNFSDAANKCFISASSITLPIIKAYVAEQSSRDLALLENPKPRVLVVDDAAMNRDIAGAFLSAAGYIVTCVEGGADAVAAVAAADFDAVLMDVRMPKVDGLEATRRIRRLPDIRGCVPIVALTAQAFSEQIAECQQAGMDGHLAKPFNFDTLLMAVKRAIEAGQHRKVEASL